MQIERILFPTDFSAKIINAREYVLYLSESLKADVYLLHAIEPLDYNEIDDEIKDFYNTLESQLNVKMETETDIFIKRGVSVHSDILIGQRWKTIDAYAKQKKIDLIVMGSHGILSESGQPSVGTTSHKVMLTSPCPVLMVRHEGD